MNRRRMLRAHLALQAAADALKEALKEEARGEWVHNETRASWELPEGTVTASVSHDRFEVADMEAFVGWLATAFPTEVKTVLVPRNPDWIKTLLSTFREELEERDGTDVKRSVVTTEDGVVVHGVAFRRGGEFITASVKPNRDLKRTIDDAARLLALTGNPDALRGLLDL